jgi:diaminopimelate epimerase
MMVMSKEISFTKMHGAGNDFIMIDDMKDLLRLEGRHVEGLCTRRRGIGADGLIIIKPSDVADFRMKYFNRDGGEAEMCGNGARCAALFARLSGIVKEKMIFETLSGLIDAEVDGNGVTIQIGEVTDLRLGLHIEELGRDVHFAVSGVPHAVILDENANELGSDEFLSMARQIRFNPLFAPKGTNVDLATIIDTGHIFYRTYERGVEAETEACGTGAIAVAVVTAHLGLTSVPLTCKTSGGDQLDVDFETVEGGATSCRLSGPAIVVYDGVFTLDRYEH